MLVDPLHCTHCAVHDPSVDTVTWKPNDLTLRWTVERGSGERDAIIGLQWVKMNCWFGSDTIPTCTQQCRLGNRGEGRVNGPVVCHQVDGSRRVGGSTVEHEFARARQQWRAGHCGLKGLLNGPGHGAGEPSPRMGTVTCISTAHAKGVYDSVHKQHLRGHWCRGGC